MDTLTLQISTVEGAKRAQSIINTYIESASVVTRAAVRKMLESPVPQRAVALRKRSTPVRAKTNGTWTAARKKAHGAKMAAYWASQRKKKAAAK